MGHTKPGQDAALAQPKYTVEWDAVITKRKNAKKGALRHIEDNTSELSQNSLVIFNDPIHLHDQWLYQQGRRHAQELAKLRNKRRWIQSQLEAKYIDGSTVREFLKLYDKTYVGKPQEERPKIEGMSGGAKLVNQHVEYAVELRLGVFGSDKADHSHGPGSTARNLSQKGEDINGVAVKDEEEEWYGFSSDEDCRRASTGR